MLVPKDGDAFAAAVGELKAAEKDRKRLDVAGDVCIDLTACGQREPPFKPTMPPSKPQSFVTSDCLDPRHAAKRLTDEFTRGFARGLQPLTVFDVRVGHEVAADATYYRIGEAGVRVSGLELMQAADVEALGYAKGEALRIAATGAMEPTQEPVVGQPMSDIGYLKRYGRMPPPKEDTTPLGPLMAAYADWSRQQAASRMAAYEQQGVPAAPLVVGWSNSGPEGDYGMLRVNLPDGTREVLYVRADALPRILGV